MLGCVDAVLNSNKQAAKVCYEHVLTSIDANAIVAKSEVAEMGCEMVCGSKCMDPDPQSDENERSEDDRILRESSAIARQLFPRRSDKTAWLRLLPPGGSSVE